MAKFGAYLAFWFARKVGVVVCGSRGEVVWPRGRERRVGTRERARGLRRCVESMRRGSGRGRGLRGMKGMEVGIRGRDVSQAIFNSNFLTEEETMKFFWLNGVRANSDRGGKGIVIRGQTRESMSKKVRGVQRSTSSSKTISNVFEGLEIVKHGGRAFLKSLKA